MSQQLTIEGEGFGPDVPVSTDCFIGAERVAGEGEPFEVTSPIDGRSLGTMCSASAAQVERAVRAATAAFPAWAALGPQRRKEVLMRFAQGISARKAELSVVETRDNGSLLIANQKRLVDRAAQNIRFFAEFACDAPPVMIAGHVDNHVHHAPAGVAALITPWNAPLMLSTWKVGPALAAGNTVVLKPPEWAPLSCSMLADIAQQAGIPGGVFNVVQGTGSVTGQALIEQTGLARISFTGSTDTGRRVGKAAAESVTPASLELGGKSPFIVFADANLDEAAKTVAAQFGNAGQVCLAGTRVIVDATVAEDFERRVRKAAEPFVVGDPRTRGVRVGPLIHPRQLERVDGFVQRALAQGAKAMIGGGPAEQGGLYYQPTILHKVEQQSEIVQHEVFGPVLTWQTFGSEDEALRLANGTEYGLAAMLYTGSAGRAERVAAGLVAGTVWVNCFFVRDLAAPFGGARSSGIGREGGQHSFDFFCDIKNVAIARDSFTEES